MINDVVLFANECLECSWLPWQHVEIMNTPSIAQLGDPSHWSDALPPHHGRMVHHRSNGQSMSQVSVSDMDPPGPDLLPQTSWPTPATHPHPTISTHRPQPCPREADRWHYVMRWWALGRLGSVTRAHAWVNVLVWCRWKGNGYLTGRMNRWSWADSRHILANWIGLKHFESAADDKKAGISNTDISWT